MPYADPIAHKECMRIYAGTLEGKAARLRASNTYRRKNREKMSAHNAVAKAILSGGLTPWPVCAMANCNCQKVEAHHADYSRPLDVIWLCDQCHKQAHVEHRQYPRAA